MLEALFSFVFSTTIFVYWRRNWRGLCEQNTPKLFCVLYDCFEHQNCDNQQKIWTIYLCGNL